MQTVIGVFPCVVVGSRLWHRNINAQFLLYFSYVQRPFTFNANIRLLCGIDECNGVGCLCPVLSVDAALSGDVCQWQAL